MPGGRRIPMIALTGAVLVLGACETAPTRDTVRHSRTGVSWSSVFGPGEAGARASARSDAGLGVRDPEAVDAVASSWIEPIPPSLDNQRVGRTSFSPERFIYTSNRSSRHRRGLRY